MSSNLIFKKVYQNESLIELEITAESKYARALQNCYTDDTNLLSIARRIQEYCRKKDERCYIEIGKKEGDFTPAFSMELIRSDALGHVKIEVDIEIDDNKFRKHRCMFYVESEMGLVEKMSIGLIHLINEEVEASVSLHPIIEE